MKTIWCRVQPSTRGACFPSRCPPSCLPWGEAVCRDTCGLQSVCPYYACVAPHRMEAQRARGWQHRMQQVLICTHGFILRSEGWWEGSNRLHICSSFVWAVPGRLLISRGIGRCGVAPLPFSSCGISKEGSVLEDVRLLTFLFAKDI